MKNKFYEEILAADEKVFTSEEKAKWSNAERDIFVRKQSWEIQEYQRSFDSS